MELLENVWGIDFNMSTNVVDVYVNYLRKKIDTNPAQKLIHTMIGMGYILKEDKKIACHLKIQTQTALLFHRTYGPVDPVYQFYHLLFREPVCI